MKSRKIFTIHDRIIVAGTLFLCVIFLGTIGYHVLGGPEYTWMDALYMTVITVSTIGYGEVIDLSNNTPARFFTMALAMVGIGLMTYVASTTIASVVEGKMNESYRRKKMEIELSKLEGHYIVCGLGRLGREIVNELRVTKRQCVMIDIDQATLQDANEAFGFQFHFLRGDATEDDVLLLAGIERCAGIFACTSDDNRNLVISLSAKHLNPDIRVVARCEDPRQIRKMNKAGADTVVSPTYFGGLKMVTDMVRPSVSSLMESLMRDAEQTIRIETIDVNSSWHNSKLEDLHMEQFKQSIVIALCQGDDFDFNPTPDKRIGADSTLVVMTTPLERKSIEQVIS